MLISVLNHPLTWYGLLASGLAGCLFLFISAKRELRAAAAKAARRSDDLAARLEALAAELKAARAALAEVEDRAAALVPPPAPRSGLNLNTRGQALRMFRRGDAPHQIAAALGIPEREVELLLKVHRIVLSVPGE